ncbi:sugar phosphate isomerase/epimerase family protein [Novipirellula herctigrandis]
MIFVGAIVTVFFTASGTAEGKESRSGIAVMETALGKSADVSSILDAKTAGYSAIQMHSGNPKSMRKKPIDPAAGLPIGEDPSIVKSWKEASEQHGIEITSLCAGSLNRCQIFDRDREVSMRIAKQTIDACHALDVKVMLFPFFGPSNFQESDEALNGVAEFMKELLPYATAKDVVIGIEAPVTTVRVLELLELLEFPTHMKVYYDVGNLFEKEDIYETIRKYGKEHFCEIHIKASGHSVVGEGQIDLVKLAEALDAAKYDHWLVYEGNRNGKDPIANRKVIEKIVSLRK